MTNYDIDRDEERGHWLQTNSGRRFFPADIRPEDICVNDIANGLAAKCRYGGQGRIDLHYSIAEHSWLVMSVGQSFGWELDGLLAALFHDAEEAYGEDLPHAIKYTLGKSSSYCQLMDRIRDTILAKYDLTKAHAAYAASIKVVENRLVRHERDFLFEGLPTPGMPWYCDGLEPLDLPVPVMGLSAPRAKAAFMHSCLSLLLAKGGASLPAFLS